jgi:hypothetical protein
MMEKKNWFWPFVNAQELLEVTTKLPTKINDPVIDVGTYSSKKKHLYKINVNEIVTVFKLFS